MKIGSLIVTAAACLLFGSDALAQDVGFTTTWSKANDLAGFEAPQGKLIWVAGGGNPGGFVRAVGTTMFVPKPYLRNDMRRVFGTGMGSISFDLKALSDGRISGGRMFLSTGSRAFSYDFTATKVLGRDQTRDDGWVHYTIPWKADWTQEESFDQGWRPFSGKDIDQWAEVLANPIYSTFTVNLIADEGTGQQSIGIDNFRIEGGTVLNAASQNMIQPPPPQKTPVAHYTFDEGRGDVLHDHAGGAAHGTIDGATWVRNGGRWALEFDGVDDSANLGALNVIGPQTLVAWIYAEPIYSVWLSVPVLGNGNLQIAHASRNVLHAGGATGFLPYKKWTHIATAWDGNTCTLYVDGTLVNVVLSKEPVASGRELLLAPPRTLQEGEPPDYDRRFKGRIGSLLFYNRPLTHDEILEDLRTSNITNSPMSMSIPQPGFGRIKVELDAARLGEPLENVTVTVEVLKASAAGDKPVPSAVVKEFDAVGRAVIDLDAPDLAQGDYVVRTTARDAAGSMLGVAGEEPLAWAGSAQFPSGPDGHRKLNNLVTELLRVVGPDNSGSALTFVNPRTGFIFISNRASREAKITEEGAAEAIQVMLSQDYGEAYETMRYLAKGRYTITTPVARDLIVRAVAQTVLDYAHTSPYVAEFGPYGGEFEEHYIYPHYNTFLVHEANLSQPFAQEWKAKGRRFVDHASAGAPAKEGQSELDALCGMLGEGAGFSHPLYDGYLVDEFAASNDYQWTWSEALERMFSDSRFMGKSVHAWTYAYYDLVTYNGGEPGRAFVRTLKKFDCPVQWECYLDSVRTELAAWRHINDKLVGEALAAEQVIPGLTENLIVAPYSYVTGGPPWLTMTLPSYDTRSYLEMQVRTLATHPEFDGVRGIGIYRSPYADEETARWMARLFRHYAIEGNTDPLGTDPFLLTHIQNPEFEQQGLGWDIKPAEEGSIEFDMHHSLGSIQTRYTGRNGDAVLMTRRSEKGPNVFSQEIRNLVPGRLYSFRMFSVDRRDMSKNERHAININFDKAEQLSEKCFTHVGASQRENTWLNWHVRVFRAQSTTATLRVSDWASEQEPGGPIGQELMYNFIKVQPYWPQE